MGPIIHPCPRSTSLSLAHAGVGIQHTAWDSGTQCRAEHALQQAKQHHLVDVLRDGHNNTEGIVKPPEQMIKSLRPKRIAIHPTGAVMIAAATM